MNALITYAGINLNIDYTMLNIEEGEIDIHTIKDQSNDDLYDTLEKAGELDSIIELVLEFNPYE